MQRSITFFLNIWNWITNWFDLPFKTHVVQEHLPRKLRKRAVYLLEEDGFMEQAAMVCPCGCGNTLNMNLLTDERPCWKVTRHDDGTASLHPSVWRKTGCASHFWFKKGRVHWCSKGITPKQSRRRRTHKAV